MKPSRPEDWTQFLRSSTPTSFGAIFPDNYEGPIREFWRQQLTGRLEHIVDVGCGNGALCLIADELLNRPELRTLITGVDFADIDPFRYLGRDRGEHPGIAFIGNARAEALPFADGSIDLVMSQYGIEYSDFARSIPEVARVLKAGGRLAFIAHDTDSEVVRLSTEHLADMRTVLGLGIHDLVLEFHDLGLALRTPEERERSAELRVLTERLDALTAQVRGMVREYNRKTQIHHYMNRLMELFAAPGRAANANRREEIVAAGEQLRSHISKIEHLREAALTEQGRRDLVALIERNGCAVTRADAFAFAPGVYIGTAVVAVRS